MNMLKQTSTYLCLVLLLLSGCMHEELGSCGLTLKLDYTDYELPQSEDENIYLISFDGSGAYFSTHKYTYTDLQKSNGHITLPIEYTEKDIIIWSGIDSAYYTLTPMTHGTSRLDDLRLALITTNNQSARSLPTLFHGRYEAQALSSGDERAHIMMQGSTNVINFSLKDQHGVALPTSAYKAQLVVANDVYDAQHSIHTASNPITYFPTNNLSKSNNKNTNSTIHTMRLLDELEAPLSVTIEGNTVSIEGGLALDIIDHIQESIGDDGEIEDIDKNHVWDVTVAVDTEDTNNYVALSIRINGWIKRFSTTPIGRNASIANENK